MNSIIVSGTSFKQSLLLLCCYVIQAKIKRIGTRDGDREKEIGYAFFPCILQVKKKVSFVHFIPNDLPITSRHRIMCLPNSIRFGPFLPNTNLISVYQSSKIEI